MDRSSNIRPTYFQSNPFAGVKSQFQQLADEVKTALTITLGAVGKRYLLTDWPTDLVNQGEFIVDDEFIEKIPPSALETVAQTPLLDANGNRQFDAQGNVVMHAVTTVMRKERREVIKAVVDSNEVIQKLRKECQTILSSRCSDTLCLKMAEFDGDAIKSWKYLTVKFGPGSHGHDDKSSAFIATLSYDMEYTDIFTEWLIHFSRKIAYVECNEIHARGLLLCNRKMNGKTVQVLPDRLMEAVKRCREDNKSYQECIKFITDEDDYQRAHGQITPNVKVRALSAIGKTTGSTSSGSMKPCYNCENPGHRVDECKLAACGWCKQFEVGHNSKTCPDRLAAGGRGRNTSTSSKKAIQTREEGNRFDRGNGKRKDDPHQRDVIKAARKSLRQITEVDNEDDDDDEMEQDQMVLRSTSQINGLWNAPEKRRKNLRMMRVGNIDQEKTPLGRFPEKDDSPIFSDRNYMETIVDSDRKTCFLVNNHALNVAVIDSGAQETVVPNVDCLSEVHAIYNAEDPSPMSVHTASGESLDVIARGQLKEVPGSALVVKGVEQTLISGPRLQEQGYWMIMPSMQASPEIGVIVLDDQGKVRMLGDRSMVTDISKVNSYTSSIDLPNLDALVHNQRFVRQLLYGLADMKVRELVALMQKTFMTSKRTMIWMASSGAIANFPLTVKQINQHWETEACYVKGHTNRRMTSSRQFDAESSAVILESGQESSRNTREPAIRDIVIGQKKNPRGREADQTAAPNFSRFKQNISHK